jgi:hypothetical protein
MVACILKLHYLYKYEARTEISKARLALARKAAGQGCQGVLHYRRYSLLGAERRFEWSSQKRELCQASVSGWRNPPPQLWLSCYCFSQG